MAATASPERLSVLVGVVVTMAASVPRYLVGGHETRLTLLLLAAGVIAAVAAWHWWLLSGEARRELLPLLKRLGLWWLAGIIATAAWQAFATGGLDAALLAAHGAALGLLVHVLWLWMRRPSP